MGVKKNVLYSTFLTGANYIFPLITYPYISRVLGPSNIGENEFALRIVGYFLLFASLGIATVGTREIAKCKQSREECSRTFSSILVLNIISTILIFVLYFICIYSVASFQRVRPLLLIGSMQIAFTPFLIEWLYKGVEDFPYITKRSLAVRILYVLTVDVFNCRFGRCNALCRSCPAFEREAPGVGVSVDCCRCCRRIVLVVSQRSVVDIFVRRKLLINVICELLVRHIYGCIRIAVAVELNIELVRCPYSINIVCFAAAILIHLTYGRSRKCLSFIVGLCSARGL